MILFDLNQTRIFMKNDITIVVCSCDHFEDTWDPFFELLDKYWDDCNLPIILTTYSKTFAFRKLNITTTQLDQYFEKDPSWSDTLLFSLRNYVSTDKVIVLLDDFFISGKVNQKIIKECCEIMDKTNCSNITLTNHDTTRIAKSSEYELLEEIDQDSPYRVTTSPAIWRKKSLESYLRKNENIWMFEIFGTIRSYKNDDLFLRLNTRNSEIKGGAIPYFSGTDDTGIVKGQWQKGIEEFFKNEGFVIDFSKRGFYKRLPSIFNKYYLLKLLIRNPLVAIKGFLGY